MNPSNFFGSQQGAFQAPNNANRSGSIFQSFAQQNTLNAPQNVSFGQTSTFGQSSAFNQPPGYSQTTGQTSVFGQSSAFGQTPSFGQSGGLVQSTGQTPAFGQSSLGQATTGFGTPPFPQSTGQTQGLMFGQTSAFGQTPAFGQTSGFGQQTPGFGLQPGISQPQGASVSSGGSGGAQPMSFGTQSAFSQPTETSSSTTSLNVQNVPNVAPKSGFGISEFSFKPSNEAVFKPIFSASPEPTNSQTSSEPFGTSKSAPTSMDSSGPANTGFSLPAAQSLQTGGLGFSFSQPAAAPSISGPAAGAPQRETLPASTSSVTGLQFTFSQPAVPSSSSTSVTQPTAVPSSPSSFTFSATVLQGQGELETFSFGAAGARQSAFGDPKVKPEDTANSEMSRGNEGHSGESTFGNFGKGTKRKEETSDLTAAQGKTAKVEVDALGSAGASRQPSKRPLQRNRALAGGLFGNAMRSVLKSSVNPVKRDPPKEDDQPPEWGQTQRPDHPAPFPQMGSISAPPPRSQAPTREVLEKAEEMGSLEATEPEAATPEPAKRRQRQESADSLGGLSPSDMTVLQCKGVPPNLNRKDVIEKHFNHFGKVRRVFCRPQKNLAIVHFQDHASAAKAKKRGKSLHGNELSLFWQRKKQSPAEKGVGSLEGEDAAGGNPFSQASAFSSSPLRRPQPRSATVSSAVSTSKGSPLKKSVIAKSLFENEPQQESASEGQSSDRSVSSLPSSLLPLVGQLAETAEEKYRLLEQRDKLLRQGRPKRTDLDMSKVFVGTCPDMCPEKERYMRETRNQLSSFEVVPETEKVDHCAAIKEYSRSSADQEEPLPHELRPLPVLSMTMDYLVTQIMDQGEGNYGDWYDFVWNRTRGIRKDITQQHLCDPETVALIEKCTRFHIHCAHHLCQEPMMSFDAKINNENMTKCLQSLKEMYQDLASRSIYCPHEAEFRQYNVLLKMNDGDILREVQQFREEVRNSPEVKFAVQAFAALNSNNFVRFFKLVKGASYLASCLLHRYFSQVRGEALRALNVAYTIGSQRPTAFPIENLVRMLMFRNVDEASGFIQHYGLAMNESMVELSRTTYQEPELSLPQRKSLAIEKKRTVLIGQVVNGEALPNPPQHVPVCSFDSQNKFRGEALPTEPAPSGVRVPLLKLEQKPVLESEPKPLLRPRQLVEPQPQAAEDHGEAAGLQSQPAALSGPAQELQSLFQPREQPQPDRPPSPPPKPEVIYSDQDIMAEVESVVDEVLVAEVTAVANAASEYVTAALSVSDVQLEAMVSEVVQEMLRDVSSSEINAEKERIAEEKRKLEEARRKQEHEALLDRFSADLCHEITEEVVIECVKETATSEIQLSQEEKAACVARSSQAVCDHLVEETLELELCTLAQEILDAELQRIRKFIKKWRDVVAVRRQLKRQMRGFPAAPCCVDLRFKLKALAPSAPHIPSLDGLAKGLVNLGNAGNMAVSCTRLLKFRKEALHQMRVHFFYSQLLSECVWTPLDLPTLVAESIPNPPDRIFWKAMLMLPSSHESDASLTNSILTDWLEAKFSGGEERLDSSDLAPAGALQTLSISNGLRELDQRTHKVHICIKVSRGPLGEEAQSQLEEGKELLGTNALLMLLPPTLGAGHHGQQEQDEEDVSMLSALLQLKQVQQASSWHAPMPLAVVVPGHLDEAVNDQKLEEDLMLKALVDDGLISEYIFIRIPETTNDMQGTEQVSQAMKWLVAHSSAASPLTSQTLVDFVEAGLCHEFSSRLYRDKQDRAQAGLPCQDPAPIIELYNSVLLFLAGLVSSEQLSNLSWPPAEFSLPETRDLLPHLDWNAPAHLAWLKRAILTLQLPEWDLPPVTASWPCLCSSIFQYVSQIPSSPHSQPLLMSRLENLMVRVRSQIPGEEEDEEDLKAGPSFQHVPWDEIIALCIDHRLKDWRPPECPVAEDAITADGQILVYFHREGLSDFVPPASWGEALKRTHQEKQQELHESRTSSRQSFTPPVHMLRQNLFQSVMEVQETPPELDLTHTPSAQELLPQRLLSGIEQEKAHSQRFEEQLRRWLDGDSLDTPSLPLFVPSTLLMLPELMTHTRRAPTAATMALAASLTQAPDADDPEKSGGDRLKGLSIAQRIQDLDRTIAASREEELAFGLTLSSLLDIVDD
ncbi:germinal-center associated nuclear protein [Alosa sapidissima]|uniref:germinal-center associated nuclear protein n=1 Tax=Alosa sapidissima TaxID=34773 RepID=UPI001C091564|nr:germinal-center associated nuclear protein [Alosa sapidissima]